ncbi:MAG: C4-dicarboxylate ABC transporter [Solobacterium sp.]|jgi:Na+/H+ antiporter NhaC|nr:C4-dicarboxylate ABC transporter [Solobacterium sp.]
MLQGILILLLMLFIMVLMVTRKMPTVLALFVLTVGICLIGGVPAFAVDAKGTATGFLQAVMESGATRLGDAIMVSIFAGWLGMVMEKTKISETMIKKGAELGGDKTFIVTLVLFIVASLLFTTVNGLGTVIMVGTIVVPILISVGADKFTATAVMLFAYCVGNNINLSNVNAIAGIFGANFNDVFLIQMVCAIGAFVSGIIFFIVHFKKAGKKFAFSAPVDAEEEGLYEIKGFTGILAMLTPLIPLILVIGFKFPLIPAFLVSIVWACLFTCWKSGWKRTMNMLTKAMFDGFAATAPSTTLMIGIGMLLMAINQTAVKDALAPIMMAITPNSTIAFIAFFIILAPLCLYRGPLNLWGLGAGIASLMVGLNVLPLNAVMGGFCAVSVMQLLCCPTNTHNVWVTSYTGEEVTSVTKRLILWIWPVVILGVLTTVFVYM